MRDCYMCLSVDMMLIRFENRQKSMCADSRQIINSHVAVEAIVVVSSNVSCQTKFAELARAQPTRSQMYFMNICRADAQCD